jgi:hypothetical protein
MKLLNKSENRLKNFFSKKEHQLIIILFLIVLVTRIFFAFQTPYFGSDEAYYNVRQVVSIKQTGLPIIKDNLSYGGKILYLPPLFYYILATLSFVFKTEFVGKFFPNLFASSIVIITYLIAAQITKNKTAQFFAATTAGFLPIFFAETINNISMNSFVIPLTFFTLYCMMKIIDKEKGYITYFIISLLALRITTPSSIFLVFALLIYLVFIYIEKINYSKTEIELILFSTFLIIWTLFVGFRNAFLDHGLSLLWQNIPRSILRDYFSNTNLLKTIYFIGIIPFIFGLASIYQSILREKDKKIYLLMSLAIVIGLLMWVRLIELNLALMTIGIVMTLLFTKSYTYVLKQINNKKLRTVFQLTILLLIILTSILPALSLASNNIKNSYSEQEIKSLLWIRKKTNQNDIILSTLNEGHLIATIARRKNFIDTNFMFVDNIDQRLIDAYRIYTTPYQTQAISLLNKYNLSYIYFSKRAKKTYGISQLKYIDERCFKKVFFNEDVEIYQPICKIEQK